MTFVKANKDTYLTRMSNIDEDYLVKEGTYLFHIESDNQIKYLESREIAVYHPLYEGVLFGYEGDWDEFDPHD